MTAVKKSKKTNGFIDTINSLNKPKSLWEEIEETATTIRKERQEKAKKRLHVWQQENKELDISLVPLWIFTTPDDRATNGTLDECLKMAGLMTKDSLVASLKTGNFCLWDLPNNIDESEKEYKRHKELLLETGITAIGEDEWCYKSIEFDPQRAAYYSGT
jgi:hypothetical protein